MNTMKDITALILMFSCRIDVYDIRKNCSVPPLCSDYTTVSNLMALFNTDCRIKAIYIAEIVNS